MYWWRSSFRAIWLASASGFILPILHEYTWLCTYIRVLSDLCMILPKVVPYKVFHTSVRLTLQKNADKKQPCRKYLALDQETRRRRPPGLEIEHDPCWSVVAGVFLATRPSVDAAVH